MDYIQDQIKRIKVCLGNPPDLEVREIVLYVGQEQTRKGSVLYCSSLVNEERIANEVIRPLTQLASFWYDASQPFPGFQNIITSAQVEETNNFVEQIVSSILQGYVLLYIEQTASWRIQLKKGEKRSITEPENEKAVRGPKDCFTENLSTNMTLVRQRLQYQNLRIEEPQLGTKLPTKVVMFYVKDSVKEGVLKEVRQRLQGIHIEALIDASYIEEIISDFRWSPFPTIEYTERPDKMAASIIEGRIAIMVDGSPTCLLAPTIFAHFLMATEDQYILPYAATAIRWLRFLALFLAFSLPSIFIALTTIHHGMIPPFLGVTLAKARTGMPFPIALEILLMESLMEIVREAGLRMPGPLGQSVTIVGTLVIGEAAVSAGLISAPVVVVVALTTLASFAIPAYYMGLSIRLMRFPMMAFSTVLGLVGVTWYLMVILIHLVGIRSFGIPYLTPLGPWQGKNVKDTILRFPRWRMDGASSYGRKKLKKREG
ncbi:spore germination protein [Fodinisporobacter ferrooxydans]|uniref:Spore germination protein n=1 Tax=Fodinisporobacter ferrooxydans TaxID=2901836 RepID=A0ABY4CP52_9BACL|nr:spore germination protein [Alicyclobacillaceae bacterium MYW30-H2]